jgi:hypothetical protein
VSTIILATVTAIFLRWSGTALHLASRPDGLFVVCGHVQLFLRHRHPIPIRAPGWA